MPFVIIEASSVESFLPSLLQGVSPYDPMSAPELIVGGQQVSLAHLAPFVFACPCAPIGRDLKIDVRFSNHCYTEGFDVALHDAADIAVREQNRVGRVFDALRYELSKMLPGIVASLPTCKVNQSASRRNYLYATTVTLPPRPPPALESSPASAEPVGETILAAPAAPEADQETVVVDLAVTYEVFFDLRRAPKGSSHDLNLVVESAYPLDGPPQVSKRPSSIRFALLALKVLRGEPVRFAAR